jgi:hypothetical protein
MDIDTSLSRLFLKLRDLSHDEVKPLLSKIGISEDVWQKRQCGGNILATITNTKDLEFFELTEPLIQRACLNQLKEFRECGVSFNQIYNNANVSILFVAHNHT